MNKLGKILHLVAPVVGGIPYHGRKEYDFNKGESNEQTLYKTADELMYDFSNDEDGAGKQYNNKVVRIIGVIKSIQQGNSQTIFLSTSSALCSFICHFPENYNGQLNHLRPWQAIVVKGLCTGILKHVVLEKCELENI